MIINKASLRHHIRHQRQQLNFDQRAPLAQHLLRHIHDSQLLQIHQHFAFYWPHNHEIDPTPILHFALANNKYCNAINLSLNDKTGNVKSGW